MRARRRATSAAAGRGHQRGVGEGQALLGGGEIKGRVQPPHRPEVDRGRRLRRGRTRRRRPTGRPRGSRGRPGRAGRDRVRAEGVVGRRRGRRRGERARGWRGGRRDRRGVLAGVVGTGAGSAAPGRAPAGTTTAADPARTVAVATARPRPARRIDRSEGTKRTEPGSLGAVAGDGQGSLGINVRRVTRAAPPGRTTSQAHHLRVIGEARPSALRIGAGRRLPGHGDRQAQLP